jgi:hypothetical protein
MHKYWNQCRESRKKCKLKILIYKNKSDFLTSKKLWLIYLYHKYLFYDSRYGYKKIWKIGMIGSII